MDINHYAVRIAVNGECCGVFVVAFRAGRERLWLPAKWEMLCLILHHLGLAGKSKALAVLEQHSEETAHGKGNLEGLFTPSLCTSLCTSLESRADPAAVEFASLWNI